jgi:adenylate kinase family enzyme
MFEDRGFRGCRGVHFDFGENLRSVVAQNCPDLWISQPEIDFLRSVLETGALLEDQHFPIAERILRRFLRQRSVGDADWVVLNGLPRHVGQAEAVEAIAAVRAVVCLVCSDETVYRRIASNAGGDRTDRIDDGSQAVSAKLKTYHKRTAPLLDHYRQRGITVQDMKVTPTTTTEALWACAESFWQP